VGSRGLANPCLALSLGAHTTGPRAKSPPADQPLEDSRQSQAKPHRSEHARAARFVMDLAAGVPLGVDARGDRRHGVPDLQARVARFERTRGASAVRGVPARPARRAGDRGRAGDPPAHAPGLSLLRDDPRHHAHAGAVDVHAAKAARMGDRGRRGGALCGLDQPGGPARVRERHVGKPRGRDRLGRRHDRGAPLGPPRRLAPPPSLAFGAARRVLAEPPGGSANDRPQRARPGIPARDRAAHLDVFRGLDGRDRALASAGQHSREARAPRGRPHVADEHRHGASGDLVGARPGLHRSPRDSGPNRQDHHGDREPREARGAFAELVRHPEPGAASAALRLDGGQRESGGRPARTRRRIAAARHRARSLRGGSPPFCPAGRSRASDRGRDELRVPVRPGSPPSGTGWRIRRVRDGSIPPTTICSRPRPVSPASSRSRRGTSPRSIGSSWGVVS